MYTYMYKQQYVDIFICEHIKQLLFENMFQGGFLRRKNKEKLMVLKREVYRQSMVIISLFLQ